MIAPLFQSVCGRSGAARAEDFHGLSYIDPGLDDALERFQNLFSTIINGTTESPGPYDLKRFI